MKQWLVVMWVAVGSAGFLANGADWPCWRGPDRDGICRETGLLKKWPEGGPRKLWSVKGIGQGYGTVAVVNGVIYVTGEVGGMGRVTAISTDGKKLRTYSYGREVAKGGYHGSRNTPTWDDGRLYVMSSYGVVNCWDAASGKKMWSVDTFAEFGGRNITWQIAESLLTDRRKVYCTPGGRHAIMAALDKKTGAAVWVCDPPIDSKSAYCSPLLVRRGRRRLLVTMVETGVIGVDADTGKFLWHHPYKNRWAVHPNTPIYADGAVFVSSGYRKGCELIKLSPDGAHVTPAWTEPVPDTHHGGLVKIGPVVYGTNNRGLACVDFATGKLFWKNKGVGKGSVLWADDRLYCYSERGLVGLLEVSAAGCRVRGTLRITEGDRQHWAHPVISGGRLYIRHGDVLMAFGIRTR